MPGPRRVIINGKFLSAESTGVHRVATELIRHSSHQLASDAALARQLSLELWVPRGGASRAGQLGLPYRVVGPLDGIAWEQVTLPARARGRMILSLCNVGPIAATNAVTMFHDAQVHITPASYRPAFRYWYRFHQPIAGRRHRRILTVSDFSKTQLAHYRLAALDRIGVVLNGVDHVTAIEPDGSIVARLGLDRHRYIVGLANTQRHKNVALLLKAFADPALGDLKLVLFGSATEKDFAAAGHPVPANVIFAGRVSDGELRALYGCALCLAFPSTTEGFGLPPVEAMTTGCPAIVAPCGALPQVCGEAALYADPDTAEEWVRAIAGLATVAGIHEAMSRKALEWSRQFTWQNAASQLIQELLEA